MFLLRSVYLFIYFLHAFAYENKNITKNVEIKNSRLINKKVISSLLTTNYFSFEMKLFLTQLSKESQI